MYRKDHCRRNLCSWKKKTEEKNSTLCHLLKANNKVTLYDLSDGYNIKHICKLFIITILLRNERCCLITTILPFTPGKAKDIF